MIVWADLARQIEALERKCSEHRIVRVETIASHIPGFAEGTQIRIHPGIYSGWVIESASLSGDVVAVVYFSNGEKTDITVEG